MSLLRLVTKKTNAVLPSISALELFLMNRHGSLEHVERGLANRFPAETHGARSSRDVTEADLVSCDYWSSSRA